MSDEPKLEPEALDELVSAELVPVSLGPASELTGMFPSPFSVDTDLIVYGEYEP